MNDQHKVDVESIDSYRRSLVSFYNRACKSARQTKPPQTERDSLLACYRIWWEVCDKVRRYRRFLKSRFHFDVERKRFARGFREEDLFPEERFLLYEAILAHGMGEAHKRSIVAIMNDAKAKGCSTAQDAYAILVRSLAKKWIPWSLLAGIWRRFFCGWDDDEGQTFFIEFAGWLAFRISLTKNLKLRDALKSTYEDERQGLLTELYSEAPLLLRMVMSGELNLYHVVRQAAKDLNVLHGRPLPETSMPEWDLPGDNDHASGIIQRMELNAIVARAGLTAREIEVLRRDVRGLTAEEIGEELGCKSGTVKRRLFEARQKLRREREAS